MSVFDPIPDSGRFAYSPAAGRKDYCWPNGARLAVYVGFNLEHFAYGEGLGACIGPASPQPDVLNYSWREYGNRVGAWRCLELFDQLNIPTGALINTALIEHCPELLRALVERGDEFIGHGHSNSFRQSNLTEGEERELLAGCRQRIEDFCGKPPTGWLSPWISESNSTSDLLAEEGYTYTLNWCHDDQPTRLNTRSGKSLWAVPYPQEVNDIPMVIGRLMDGAAFADMIIDNFDEMLHQSQQQPLAMGIALHAYIVGQPYRLRHLRRALTHIATLRDRGEIWLTTPGRIGEHAQSVHAC
jgi:allantoinase